MKVIRVQYSIKEDFVEQNKRNIESVMEELRSMNINDIKYVSYQLPDRKTFVHMVIYNTDDAEQYPGILKSFKQFQKELKEHIEIPPEAKELSIIGSSFEIFN